MLKDSRPDQTVSGLTVASNQLRKKQHGAQQLVLLDEVCLETHPCPAQAHVEISVSVEVVWFLQSPHTCTPSPSSHSQSRTVPLVCLTCPRGGTATPTPSAHDQSRSAPLVCFTRPRGGTAPPTPPAHDQSRTAPLSDAASKLCLSQPPWYI